MEQGLVRVLMLDKCHLLWRDLCGYVWGKSNERIEVDMTNYRNKQTYYGAVDYHTGEFLIKAYPKGNSDQTIEFLQYLQIGTGSLVCDTCKARNSEEL